MNEIAFAVAGSLGIVGLFGVLIKFIIDAVFSSLQTQIDQLRKDAGKRELEIMRLRGMIDEWQIRYRELDSEYSLLQVEHLQLRNEFNALKQKLKDE